MPFQSVPRIQQTLDPLLTHLRTQLSPVPRTNAIGFLFVSVAAYKMCGTSLGTRPHDERIDKFATGTHPAAGHALHLDTDCFCSVLRRNSQLKWCPGACFCTFRPISADHPKGNRGVYPSLDQPNWPCASLTLMIWVILDVALQSEKTVL